MTGEFVVRDEDVATFRRDGVVALRGVLSPEWIDRLRPAVGRILDSDAAGDLTAMAGGTGGGFRAGIDHWLTDDDLRSFAESSPLPATVAALLGSERLWLYEDSVLAKAPGTAEETRFHTDLPYFHVVGDQLATTWCPLDPVTEATGSLRFVRGSHRWDREFRPNLFVTDEPIPGTEGEIVPPIDPAGADVLCFELEPGDVTVHHARTLHGAGPNTSPTTWRRAVSVRYCGDDARVRFRTGLPVSPHHRDLVEGEALPGGDVAPLVWPT